MRETMLKQKEEEEQSEEEEPVEQKVYLRWSHIEEKKKEISTSSIDQFLTEKQLLDKVYETAKNNPFPKHSTPKKGQPSSFLNYIDQNK